MDQTLTTHDRATGRNGATSYRCADMDRIVPSLIGVSKARGSALRSALLLSCCYKPSWCWHVPAHGVVAWRQPCTVCLHGMASCT